MPEEEIAAYYEKPQLPGGPGPGRVYFSNDPSPGLKPVIVEFFGMYDPGWDLRCY